MKNLWNIPTFQDLDVWKGQTAILGSSRYEENQMRVMLQIWEKKKFPKNECSASQMLLTG